MSIHDHAAPAPQSAGSAIKLAIRRLILTVLLIPVFIVGLFLLLPTFMPDAGLELEDDQFNRSLMIGAASLLVAYIVHRATLSWKIVPSASASVSSGGDHGN